MNFIIVSVELVISVGKRYTNGHKRRLYTHPKKYWNVFFYDEYGNFQSKRIHWYEVLKYKRRKVKRIYDK